MAEVVLGYDVFIDAIAEEADRLSQAIADHLAENVPTCPEWSGSDLVDHLTTVYRRWAGQLRASDSLEELPATKASSATDTERMAHFDEAASQIVEALHERLEDAACWNYIGEDFNALWVARRVAHESAIHRIDAELISGATSSIDRELAADGLSERITVILPLRVPERNEGNLGGSLCLVCEDTELSYVVEAEAPKWRFRSHRGPADCVVVGSSADLFRFSWNRPTGSPLELTGDLDVVAAWSTLPG